MNETIIHGGEIFRDVPEDVGELLFKRSRRDCQHVNKTVWPCVLDPVLELRTPSELSILEDSEAEILETHDRVNVRPSGFVSFPRSQYVYLASLMRFRKFAIFDLCQHRSEGL